MTERAETIECPIPVHALRTPDAVALVDGESSLTYSELEASVEKCAATIRESGVAENGRVAILAANSVEYAVLIHTLYRIGAVAVPLNLRWTSDAWMACAKQAGCGMVLADRDRSPFTADMGLPRTLIGEDWCGAGSISGEPHPPVFLRDSIDAEARTTIIFTSGSTGQPRGVILTFGNHYYSALGSNLNLPLEQNDCWLAVLPFFHAGGHAILFRSAVAGSAVHIQDEFDAPAINRLIDAGRITHISLVPTMLRRLIEDRGTRAFPPRLKAVLLGGAPIPDALMRACVDLSIPVAATYGLTETASQVATSPPGVPRGRPQPGVRPLKYGEVKIVDRLEGDAAEGEIAVRGRVLFRGYIDEDPAVTFDADGWFHTGDVGILDSYGLLKITGRLDDMIISGGENVNPLVIEKIASSFPGVAESAVIAVEDEEWGQRPVLFVTYHAATAIKTTRKDLKARLIAFLGKRLSRVEVPDSIITIAEMPRTAIGKIDRVKLEERYKRGDE